MRRKEHSFGIIPLRKYRGKWQVLLVQHGKGHWAFPKGHANANETPEETAVREFNEETGLQIATFLDFPVQQEHYFFRHGPDLIDKTVSYFIAEVKGKLKLQKEEISDYKWLSLKEAEHFATFENAKKICAKIASYMT